MDRWMSDLQQMLNLLLGTPTSELQRWVTLALALLVMLWALGKAGSAFGIPNTGPHYSLFSALLGVALSLVVMVAAKLYLPGAWNDPKLRLLILAGGPVLVSLVVVVPLMCAVQKTGYIEALFTWALSVGAAALIILLVGAVFDMVASGGRDAEKSLRHKQDMEKFLQSQ